MTSPRMVQSARVIVRADVVRTRLRERGISQNRLAQKVCLSRGYLSQLLNRQRFPRRAVQERLMRELRVSDPGELFEVLP